MSEATDRLEALHREKVIATNALNRHIYEGEKAVDEAKKAVERAKGKGK